jgi:hypothetical protein
MSTLWTAISSGVSHAEFEFAAMWDELYPNIDLHAEYRFDSKRRYRLDFAHLPSKTGIEIQGATWVQNTGHSSGRGIQRDIEKVHLAALHGWQIIPLLSEDASNPEKLKLIADVIALRGKA